MWLLVKRELIEISLCELSLFYFDKLFYILYCVFCIKQSVYL